MERRPPPPLPGWLAEMLPFRRTLVEVEDHRIHVMESGEGLPVVMLHGNPTWGFLWRKVAQALPTPGLRVILPDLVGLGLSDKPRDPGVHTLENHGRWIAAVLDGLGLSRYVLVAQDWGGAIGLVAASEHPERLAGLVLANTAVGPPKPGFKPTLFHRASQWPGVSGLLFRELNFPVRGMRFAQGDRGSVRGRVADAYRWPLRRRVDRVAPLALARMVPDGPDHPSVPALQRSLALAEAFEGPAALVWGERDPILGRLADRVHRTLPQATLTRTQAGHFLQEEVPHVLAAAIRQVARKVDAAS